MMDANVTLSANCGCGQLTADTRNGQTAPRVLALAMEHTTMTGHAVELRGEVRQKEAA